MPRPRFGSLLRFELLELSRTRESLSIARSRRFSLPLPSPLRRIRSELSSRPPRFEEPRLESSRRLPLSLLRLLLSLFRLGSLLRGSLGSLGGGLGGLGGGLGGLGVSTLGLSGAGLLSCCAYETVDASPTLARVGARAHTR